MNELMLFSNEEFGEVRSLLIDNEPWFVGKDVAKALGYRDTDQAIRKHVDKEDKLIRQFDGSGQKRNMTVINESGLYSLILSSKLPSAKRFKRWVTSEVLPQIRKTGKYEIQNNNSTELNTVLDILHAQQEILSQRTMEIHQEIEEVKQLVGLRKKEVYSYSNQIKQHLGISIISENPQDYENIKNMFFYELGGYKKWEDVPYSRDNIKLLQDICNDYKPPQIRKQRQKKLW